MSAEKKTEIYSQHLVGRGFYMCPSCMNVHLGGLTIENIEDDSDELPQVYCRYGCGYIFLPNLRLNNAPPRDEWWKKHLPQ
jgi:uncharacterized protein YutD